MAGTPPFARGTLGSIEDGPGRYTYLLYVDFQEVGRGQEMSRENYAEFLLERSLARGDTGSSARCVEDLMSASVPRRARHTKSLAYQHDPVDQVGVSADATVR